MAGIPLLRTVGIPLMSSRPCLAAFSYVTFTASQNPGRTDALRTAAVQVRVSKGVCAGQGCAARMEESGL